MMRSTRCTGGSSDCEMMARARATCLESSCWIAILAARAALILSGLAMVAARLSLSAVAGDLGGSGGTRRLLVALSILLVLVLILVVVPLLIAMLLLILLLFLLLPFAFRFLLFTFHFFAFRAFRIGRRDPNSLKLCLSPKAYTRKE